jgi:hypothetical protein
MLSIMRIEILDLGLKCEVDPPLISGQGLEMPPIKKGDVS